MQARVAQHGEILIIQLSGRVDVETAEPFRNACLNHLKNKRVVFDFRSLSFVGSSGILPFLETMQEFANNNPGGMKFSGVSSEFKKVFAATPLNAIEIFDTDSQALHAFLNPQPIVVAMNPLTAAQAAPIIAHTPDEEREEATQPREYLSFRPQTGADTSEDESV